MVLECEHCSALVDAQVIESYTVHEDVAPSVLFSFARCPRCSSPFLAVQDEDFPDGWMPPQRLFPASETRLSSTLPKPIQIAFEEASRCLRAKAHTAAAIMCRKTLEGICAAHGAAGKNLAQSLKKLRDDGTIDQRLFEWAEELRLFGNEAAHDVNVTIAPQDAGDIVDFTRALIEYVFTFQERFQAFKQRRVAKQAGA